jgi:hypothetical protein
MAGRYFDPDKTTDLAFLPVESQDATDLDLFASEAEADTILFYTRDLNVLNTHLWGWATIRSLAQSPGMGYTPLGDNLGIFLRFYETDPADVATTADATAFVTAMKRTIAAVIGWRISQSKIDTMATQEDSATRRVVRSSIHLEPYPPNWTRWLESFSTLPPVWTL